MAEIGWHADFIEAMFFETYWIRSRRFLVVGEMEHASTNVPGVESLPFSGPKRKYRRCSNNLS
jgi:hypothetical protein